MMLTFLEGLIRYASRASKQWLAVLFSASLAFLALLLTLNRTAAHWMLCSSNETSVSVCVRNWISPLSGLSSAFIAGAALIFAYQQYRIAADQQSLSILKDRLEKIDRLQGVAIQVSATFYEASMALSLLCEAAAMQADLQRLISNAQVHLVAAHDFRNELRPIVRDATMDLDLRDLADEILEMSDFRRLPSTRNLAEAVRTKMLNRLSLDIELYRAHGIKEANQVNVNIRKLIDEAGRLADEIKLSRHKVLIKRQKDL